MTELLSLGLRDLHEEMGARMVGFAGYAMPVQYPLGVMGEHQHTRHKAGLFDVSHMGQVILRPKSDMTVLGAALERLMPVDVLGLAPGRQRYGLLTNAAGGILDDLMFANRGDHILMVVNAGNKRGDIAHLQAELAMACDVVAVTDRALLALQGPMAEAALVQHAPEVAQMRFMDVATIDSAFGPLWISRSGYTGEDGFEISVLDSPAEGFARALLAHDAVELIGLGARDSLRLEAGLCLHGHEIDVDITPVEAGLNWAIQKVRRPGGARAGGFIGADVILPQLTEGAARRRVGLRPGTRAPMREGTVIYAGETAVGHVTSGGFGPTIGAPVAMGFVTPDVAEIGTELTGDVRGKRLALTVCPLPFTPAGFKR